MHLIKIGDVFALVVSLVISFGFVHKMSICIHLQCRITQALVILQDPLTFVSSQNFFTNKSQ